MTYLSERQAERLKDRLLDLPRLAAATVPDGPGGTTVASAAPPGTDLRAVDAGREQPKLLAKVSECIRVVCEEMPRETYLRAPDLRPEGQGTWHTETAWLVATMGWWQGDDWCAEWIATAEREARGALVGLIEQHAHYRTCGVCGQPVEAYQSGDYAIAECPKCERVLGMVETGYAERIKAARNLLRAIGRIA